jgi:beta-lactamase class A
VTRRLLPVLLALCGLATFSEAAAQTPGLEARLRARLDSLQAVTSVYAKHLPSGSEVAVRADQPMNTLSVIKIPVMVLAFRDAEAGRLDLEERYRVRDEDIRGGSGILRTFVPGLEPTYRDLITQMIITSDNTATDIVIGKVGLERVNQMLDSLGYRETRLRTTTGELFRRLVERGAAAEAAGRPSPDDLRFAFEGDSTEWLGRTTAREMSRLLEKIHRGELASQEHTREMISILRRQLYASRLPQRVRYQGVGVAHKTGDWPPIGGSDVGILYYEGGPVVVSAFTGQNRSDFFELEATLGRIAEDLVNAWK